MKISVSKGIQLGGFMMIIILSISSCKTSQWFTGGDVEDNTSATYIMRNLEQTENSFEWFSAKIGTKFHFKNNKNSFRTSVRIRKDSVIWINITFSSLPVGIAMITPDSVKFVNKHEKYVMMKPFSWIKENFAADLSFEMLQDLLVGNAVAYDTSGRYKTLEDSSFYILSTHSQRQLEKAFAKLPRKQELQYVQRYWIDPSTFKVKKTLINHLIDTSSLEIRYIKFKEEDSLLFPDKFEIEGTTPSDTILLELNYSKHKVNKPQKFPFKYNDRYEIRD